MTAKRVSLKELSREIPGFARATVAKQREAVTRGLAKSLPMLAEKSPVDTGLYAQSWDFTVTEEKAILGNFAPHAPIIEYGARPFTPPLAPLLAWAKRVLKSGSQPPDYESKVWALARYTQKKISEQGIKPRNVLRDAIPDILKNIKQELDRL